MYKEPQPEKIHKMFSQIAPSYDSANSILSLGIHMRWKQKLVENSGAQLGSVVLDCATGTGDVALLFKKQVGKHGRVIATDFCQDILQLAPPKAKKLNLHIDFEVADVTQLPYPDHFFDVSSISFGIRNVGNLKKALSELARVTKPTGKVMILEFGQIQIPVIKELYNFYARNILPKLGGLVSGNTSAYEYLNESSEKFPCAKEFINVALSTEKYKTMTYSPLSLGVAYLYEGTPISHS